MIFGIERITAYLFYISVIALACMGFYNIIFPIIAFIMFLIRYIFQIMIYNKAAHILKGRVLYLLYPLFDILYTPVNLWYRIVGFLVRKRILLGFEILVKASENILYLYLFFPICFFISVRLVRAKWIYNIFDALCIFYICYFTSIFLGSFVSGRAFLGIFTVKTPFSCFASILFLSTLSGRTNVCWN